MKILKLFSTILVVCGVIFLSLSCSGNAGSTSTPTTRTATVTLGNISQSITGTGNLAYSKTAELAFEMDGYVEEVLVEAGDTVTAGQELAKLNTSDWEEEIKTLNKNLTTAQRALEKAETALATAERQISSKELAVQQAQIDMDNAEYKLSQISKVKSAQSAVDSAEATLELAKAKRALDNSSVDTAYIRELQAELDEANANLQQVLKGTDTSLSTTVALEIAKDQLAVLTSQKSFEEAQLAVQTAQNDIKDAQADVADAKQDVQDAQADLDAAKSLNPIITAPFDGYIIDVKVSGGDEIFEGTVAIEIADPTEFEANILVTENDILSVKLGGEATVSIDSLTGTSYPASISWISPTAKVSSGVVNYEVTVKLTSLEPVTRSQKSPQVISGMPPSGTLPPGVQSVGTPASGVANPSAGMTSATPSTVANSSETTLKDGLSATVEIISQHKDNVLVIPNRALKSQGGNYTVQVVNGTATETRTVKAGITDNTSTEITEGLKKANRYSTRSVPLPAPLPVPTPIDRVSPAWAAQEVSNERY